MRVRHLMATLVMAAMSWLPAISAISTVPTETQCTSTIVDGANLFKGDIAAVSSAADQLETLAPGTVVVVRTYPKVRESLRATLTASIADCPNWRDAQGRQAASSLFFMVSLDTANHPGRRELAIYAGDTFGPALVGSGAEERIRLNTMTPLFKKGEFARGMATAMQQSYQVLHPAPVGADPITPIPGEPAGVPGEVPVTETPRSDSTPTDWSWIGTALKWLVRIILGVIGIVVLFSVISVGGDRVSRLMRERRRHRQLLADATRLQSTLTELIRRVEVLSRDEHPLAPGWLNQLQAAAAGLQQAGTRAPVLTAGMPGWQQTAHQISDHVSDFDSRVSRCAAELLTSQARYVATAGLVQDLIKGGWTPDDLAAKLDKVRGDLATANDHKQAGRDVIAVILLELANAEIDQLVPALQQIKDRREAIAAKLQKLQPITAQAMASIEQATGIITRLSSTYAPSAWEQLKGNGAKSTALLADAQKQLEAATASLTSGDLDTADSQLVQAEKQLAEVKSQMRSVQTLASSLDDTAADLPRLLKAAQQALEQARKAEHDFDTDAGDAHKAELVSVAEMLAEAEQLCHVEPLDPLAAANAIREADLRIDAVFKAVMNEHQVAERERQRAIDEATSAQAAVANAREYQQDHGSHVRPEDQEALEAAHKALKDLNQLVADGNTVPVDKIKAAQRTAALAEQAFRPVRERVLEIQRQREAAAEAERQRIRRQREAAEAAAAAAEAERQKVAAQRRADQEAERRRQAYSTPSYPHVEIPGTGSGTWGGSSIWSGSGSSGTSGGSNTW